MILSFLFRTVLKALGLAVHLLAIVLKIVYNILKFLHVRLLASYLIVCGLVQLIARPFVGEAVTYFWLGLVLCVTVTVVSWGVTLRSRRRKSARRKEAEEPEEEPEQKEAPPKAREHYPRYFDAEGREGYIFAEFADRFELYRREGKEYVLERVDKKEKV